MTKILGIDLGTKRIGLALSNIERSFAFPLKVMEVQNLTNNIAKIAGEIADLAKTEGVTEIVIGESKNFKGIENPIMQYVHLFKAYFLENGFTVVLEPEFLTSEQAQRHQGKGVLLDASAAAIILQSYLDRLQKANQA